MYPRFDSRPQVARSLFALTAFLFVLRLAWILGEPDLDGDAYGHFGIGCTLAGDPWNLTVHWVWLPLYHYVLALFVRLHLPFAAVRVSASICSFVLPWALFRFVGRNADAEVARDAATACALASAPNVLGVSAQQEAWFALLILLAASAIDAKRMLGAGLLLAAACLVRYEAWGAAALVFAQGTLVRCAPPRVRSRLGCFGDPLPPEAFVPPLSAVAFWLLVHRLGDGEWLGFLRELYTFTHMQRAVLTRGPLFDALWFPIAVPLAQFGPALLFVPFGVRVAWSRGWIVPLAVYAFLLTSYAGGGSLGGARYYASLVPFFCAAMAHGVRTLAVRRRRASLGTGRAVLWGSLALLTALNFISMKRDAGASGEALRLAERRLDACR